MKLLKVVFGLFIVAWFTGLIILYWGTFPLRPGFYFAGFFDQFVAFSGFNFSYIADILFMLISLWFSMLIGYLISRGIQLRFHSMLELMLISTGMGLFVLGMLVFVVGVIGALYSWLFQLIYLGLAPLLAVIIGSTHLKDEFLRHTSHRRTSTSVSCIYQSLKIMCAVVIVIALVVGFLYTLTPPTQSDGLRYHLTAPQEYIKHHALIYIPFNAFSNFPFLIEMLFSLGMMLWDDILAKLFHFSFLVLSGLLLSTFWRHIIKPDLKVLFAAEGTHTAEDSGTSAYTVVPVEWLSMLIFFTTPAILIVGCWEFIDLGMTFYFLGMVYAIARWTQEHERPWLVVAAIFCGAALGTKYTMVFFLFIAALWILLSRILSAETNLRFTDILNLTKRHLLIFVIIAGILALPWYIKNLVNTGNPVYPFAHGIFNGGEWTAETDAFYKSKAGEKGFTLSLSNFITAPWDTAFYWGDFETFNPGVIYLAFFPFIVVLGFILLFRTRRRALSGMKTIIIFTFSYYLLWYFSYQSNRFLIPYYALSALLIVGVAIKLYYFWKPLRWIAVAAIIVCSVYAGLWSTRWILTEARPQPLPVVIGFETRNQYLSKALNYYPATRWLNLRNREKNEKVLFVGEHRGYYFTGIEYLGSDWFDIPYIIHLIRTTANNDELFRWLEENNVRYVFINLAELGAYYDLYFKPRFRPNEVRRVDEFIASERLKRVFPPAESMTYICAIEK